MFLGHYAAAFALKRAEPKISLAALFLAVQMVDIAFGATLLLGWERAAIVPGATAATPLVFDDYPLTHSLLAGVIWGLGMAALYYSWPTRDTSRHLRASIIVGAAVLSHWVLDAIAHVPDMPIAGTGSLKVGLGLWRSLPLTLVVELGLLAGGLWLFLGGQSRRHHVYPNRLAILVGLLLIMYFLALFGPPPPDIGVLGFGALALILPAAVALWAGRTT